MRKNIFAALFVLLLAGAGCTSQTTGQFAVSTDGQKDSSATVFDSDTVGVLSVTKPEEGDAFLLKDTIRIQTGSTGTLADAQPGVRHELFLANEEGTFVGKIGRIEAGETSYDWKVEELKHYGGLDYFEKAPSAGAYRVVYVVWNPEIPRKDTAADIPDQDLTSGKTTYLNGEIRHYGGKDKNELDPTDVIAAAQSGLFRVESDGMTGRQAISYATYSNQETGISFDVPTGSTVRDGVNGFEDVWKFQYDGDSYVVSFNQFKEGAAIYAGWDDPRPTGAPEVLVERLDGKTIYSLKDTASTEVYFTDKKPTVSISVSKHEGEALSGEASSSEDAVYQHLVDSVKMNDEKAF